jgi:hypothetical protein
MRFLLCDSFATAALRHEINKQRSSQHRLSKVRTNTLLIGQVFAYLMGGKV